LTKAYYRGAAGIILVFDVTDAISFNNLVRYWFKKIHKYADENVQIILLGNKIDLFNEITIDEEEAQKMAA
jgi:Ras-related protein Rab-1A